MNLIICYALEEWLEERREETAGLELEEPIFISSSSREKKINTTSLPSDYNTRKANATRNSEKPHTLK